jgi:hypothetical protein
MPSRPIPFEGGLRGNAPKPQVAPLGSVGQAQQTVAAQVGMPQVLVGYSMSRSAAGTARRRKRRKAKRKTRRTKRSSARKTRRTKRRSSRRARLVKGSAAAKRYMAKLRRMRK